MSYDDKYRKWVEKETKKNLAMGLSDIEKVYEVYRGMPVLREKINENPPEYRFRAPRIRARKIERLHEKIDKKLDTIIPSQKIQDSDGLYRQKWENSQIELSDAKKREDKLLSEIEVIQRNVDEMKTQIGKLQKESIDLKRQIKEAKEIINKRPKK